MPEIIVFHFINLWLIDLQIYLTHDDFVSIFNMSFRDFRDLPVWKQQELKKANKLF